MRGQAKMGQYSAPCDNEECGKETKRQVNVPQKRINMASKRKPKNTYSVWVNAHRCLDCDK